ncbi:MAG: hypothetical protein EOP53_08385 [Sphingobacteriales bacterium]|nr:MAG: hypothetical protein EOP53_08385 [Sphingobacteriales bacterium]
MKNALLIILVAAVLFSCKKDKFTTAPQIEFVDISPNFAPKGLTNLQDNLIPKLIFNIRDAEGDFGTDAAGDSSWIFIKHSLTAELDSVRFPNLQRAPKNNFDAEVSASLFRFLDCNPAGGGSARVDTIFYQVYVKDAKGNKSNVFTTTKPVLVECN